MLSTLSVIPLRFPECDDGGELMKRGVNWALIAGIILAVFAVALLGVGCAGFVSA